MLIVTTRNRLIAFTVLFVALLLAGVAHFVYHYHKNTVVAPNALTLHLLSVAAGQQSLSAADYDHAAIRRAAKSVVRQQLSADLAHTNLPASFDGSALLGAEATAFLDDDKLLNQWLKDWLQHYFNPAKGDYRTERLAANRRLLLQDAHCMLIVAVDKHWHIQTLGPCAELEAQAR